MHSMLSIDLIDVITSITIIFGKRCSNFPSDIIEEVHEKGNINDIMTILHNGDNNE